MQLPQDPEIKPIIEALQRIKHTEAIDVDTNFRKQLEEKLRSKIQVMNQNPTPEDDEKRPWWQLRLWVALVPTALVLVVVAHQFLTLPVTVPTNRALIEQAPIAAELNPNNSNTNINKEVKPQGLTAPSQDPSRGNTLSDTSPTLEPSTEQVKPSENEPQQIKKPNEITSEIDVPRTETPSANDINPPQIQPQTNTEDAKNFRILNPQTIAEKILKKPEPGTEQQPDSKEKKIASSEDTSSTTSINAAEKNEYKHTLDENDVFIDNTEISNIPGYQVVYRTDWDAGKKSRFEVEVINPLLKEKIETSWNGPEEIEYILVEEKTNSTEATVQIYYKNALVETTQYYFDAGTNQWHR